MYIRILYFSHFSCKNYKPKFLIKRKYGVVFSLFLEKGVKISIKVKVKFKYPFSIIKSRESKMEEMEEIYVSLLPSRKKNIEVLYKDYYGKKHHSLIFWSLYKSFVYFAKRKGVVWAATHTYTTAEDQIYAILLYRRYDGLTVGQIHRRISKEEEERIVKMYISGFSIYRIAKELHRPFSTVYYVLRRNGLK